MIPYDYADALYELRRMYHDGMLTYQTYMTQARILAYHGLQITTNRD